MKIGFFGGSFNPPTNAHIYLAKKAIMKCKLDKIIFVPMSDFYKKDGLARAEDRYNMLKIVCDEEKQIEVSDIELKVNKELFAIDAFKLIEENYKNHDNYFLMGADNFLNLLNWKDSHKLIHEYKYIVFEREDLDIRKYIKNSLGGYIFNIQIIKNEEFNMTSSTEFRNLLNSDLGKKQNMVPKRVLEYIVQKNLYIT